MTEDIVAQLAKEVRTILAKEPPSSPSARKASAELRLALKRVNPEADRKALFVLLNEAVFGAEEDHAAAYDSIAEANATRH
jgi:hypothetical protein